MGTKWAYNSREKILYLFSYKVVLTGTNPRRGRLSLLHLIGELSLSTQFTIKIHAILHHDLCVKSKGYESGHSGSRASTL
jgi:hypothetical protein